ncbi:M28 family metallopeptidase [Nocardioides sp. WS12]|uniref:M28 family metallopeptidase n=1 Tax=Nocardioides sp. WS12 TaxID=2486272 RepID=UPI00191F76B4|nr:M28 family metallopeptidase [Nocardioides sp. WS12]
MGLAAVAVVTVMAPTTGSTAAPTAAGPVCERRQNNTYAKLLECVGVAGVRKHQAALQAVADANGGNRFSGLAGYDGSVDYVVSTLRAAGYTPVVQEFDYLAFEVAGPSSLQQTQPNPTTYVEGVDFGAITQSDPGDITASVTPVDLALGLGNASTSGCDVGDFAGFPAGDIALLQRGTCTFEIKAENAAAAGAVGIVIFNQGNTDAADRQGIPAVTLSANNTSGIPVIGTTYALGAELAATPALEMRVFANTLRQILPTANVLAEKKGINTDNVVMAGAHLDSVLAGPGINDNGSGSAAVLETAVQIAKLKPVNTLRFAWWGAEESGLVGSTNYVNGLSAEEKDRIALYLNFDMIGSPNYIQMVYDSDESGFAAPVTVPPGSVAIEDLFESFYTLRSEPYDDAEFSGRSDYQAFINNGIPAGGLFTGAEVPKTAEQQSIWGGTAGAQYDPCYHAACDTFANVSTDALAINSDAVAFAVLTYAFSTEAVNGVPGEPVPGDLVIPPPAGPQGTVGSGGGGAEDKHLPSS